MKPGRANKKHEAHYFCCKARKNVAICANADPAHMRRSDMALVTVSAFTHNVPTVSRTASGSLSIYYTGGVHISLSDEEAVALIADLTALLNPVEAVAEEVAA